ncbi:FAD-binding and (Fe-S)-binding domain-containing protein [Marinospirillum perlucidum]|uniref:FAD-binding and (Fe-S)-binding domain-containing protein n=1 Tax=Marinospirillum perlucidum TaxID=1982602 RepID=UPI000DF3733D|nr:FAD-binding and (Fe-S)-binding domain-containing protein [Marinospirillum perlucidum]
MSSPYSELHQALAQQLPEQRLISDELRTLAYGTDASFYRLVPGLVVRVESEQEVQLVLKESAERGLPVTFRAAGTSLSGQAVTDSVLIQLGNGWKDHEILESGEAIRLKPGVIGAQANKYLAPLNRKIGPDPASINACMIGGIAANNASGMCCGTAQNSYNTLQDIRVVFADGSLLDTADPESVAAFRQSHGDWLERLANLGEETRHNIALAEKIRHKYRLKNTTGYSLNALVDFVDPLEILKHLLIGSEGTLGFISEITYRTVPDYPNKAAALIYFPDMASACRATTAMKPTPVSAVELLDRAALRAVEEMPGMPTDLKSLPEEAAALLVDVRGSDSEHLEKNIAEVTAALEGMTTLQPVHFTLDLKTYELYWKIRKGTFPAVGAERVIGTTVIIEDVAFPLERLAEGVTELQALFRKYEYNEAILFGHALEGNLHFVFTQGFDDPAEVERYEALMDEVAQLVAVKYGGSLKAEHGTGRNMAPYVELEWGSEAYALMKAIKQLFDPANLLNPDVILSDNAQIHLQNLKPLPEADPLVDKCIECGFCEAVCPSRRLTLTPRQRIVIWRELQRRRQQGEDAESIDRLEAAYQYQGLDTCAADGLCSTQCPVGINTGDLVRGIRRQQNLKHQNKARWIASHFDGVTRMARGGIRLAQMGRKVIGDSGMAASMTLARKAGVEAVGHWLPSMPQPAKAMNKLGTRVPAPSDPEAPAVVYWPSCASRVLGQNKDASTSEDLSEVTINLLHKAGYRVIFPEGVDALCCGMPFQSKGLFEVADSKQAELVAALYKASEQGRWPVIADTSPCNFRLEENGVLPQLQVYEASEFVAEKLLDRLKLTPKKARVAVHVTCSTTRRGKGDLLVKLAKACVEEIVLPESVTCCGFAGDRGFQQPDLNASALQDLRKEVAGCEEGYSNSRTCELGLTQHSGVNYQSILYLVDEVST